jgi:hypothetical protein
MSGVREADAASALLAERLCRGPISRARRTGSGVLAGRRMALDLVAPSAQLSHRPTATPPALRFDRVALRVLARLREAAREAVPEGWTVMVTVTAPIWLPGKTADTLAQRIRQLLARGGRGRAEFAATIHRNRVRIRIVRGGSAARARFVGFIHNPKPAPAVLFDLTTAMLRALDAHGAARKHARPRALVVRIADAPRWTLSYAQVCAQLLLDSAWQAVLLVGSDGKVMTLID